MEIARRIQRARLVVARFGPIMEAGLSQEWTEAVGYKPDWQALRDLLSVVYEESPPASVETFAMVLDPIGILLDLWDEDPVGPAYYPYKSAELIELHCRMVTGDLSDNAPVGLDEWLGRFARHVDWQLNKSRIDLQSPNFFSELEGSLNAKERQFDGAPCVW